MVVDSVKKFSDAELIIKFASIGVGERISFSDLISEIYIPTECKEDICWRGKEKAECFKVSGLYW